MDRITYPHFNHLPLFIIFPVDTSIFQTLCRPEWFFSFHNSDKTFHLRLLGIHLNNWSRSGASETIQCALVAFLQKYFQFLAWHPTLKGSCTKASDLSFCVLSLTGFEHPCHVIITKEGANKFTPIWNFFSLKFFVK